MTAITVTAPAKVNLYLHVTGRRADGYHLLESLVAFTDFGDGITATPSDRLTLTVDGPFADRIPTGPDNLILQAAQGLRDLCDIQAGAHIHLDKRLPVAAGIGGGSADAAATLTALCRLWQVDPDPARLDALALGLGADVPVCLRGQPAHMAGVGEEITLAPDLPDLAVLLVNPGVALSTPAVFKARNSGFSPPDRLPDRAFADRDGFLSGLAARGNDLMAAATRIAPVVGTVMKALDALGGCRLARMSGSGATCFALFDSSQVATQAAAVLAQDHPGWWCATGRFKKM